MAHAPAQFYQPQVSAAAAAPPSAALARSASAGIAYSPSPSAAPNAAATPMMPPAPNSHLVNGYPHADSMNGGLGQSPNRPLSSASQHTNVPNGYNHMAASPAQSSVVLGNSRAATPSQMQYAAAGLPMQQQPSAQSQYSQGAPQAVSGVPMPVPTPNSASVAAANAAASFSLGHRQQGSYSGGGPGGISSLLASGSQPGYIGPRLSQASSSRGSPSLGSNMNAGQFHNAGVAGTPLMQPQTPIYRSELDRVKSERMLRAQQAAAATMRMAERALRDGSTIFPPGAAILRIMQYTEAMSVGPGRLQNGYWRSFVDEFFTPEGLFRIALLNPATGEHKVFEVPNSVLPRFLMTSYVSGLRAMQLTLDNPREYTKPGDAASAVWYPTPLVTPPHLKMPIFFPSPSATHVVEASRAMFMSTFENGWQVQMIGHMRIIMAPHTRLVVQEIPGMKPKLMMDTQLRMESMDYFVQAHNSFIPRFAIVRSKVEHAIPQATIDAIRVAILAEGKDGKEVKPEHLPKMVTERVSLPECPVNEYGITLRSMRCLEICESVCELRDLMDYSLQERIGPIEAIRQFSARYEEMKARMANATSAPPASNAPRQSVSTTAPASPDVKPLSNGAANGAHDTGGPPNGRSSPAGQARAVPKRKGTADSVHSVSNSPYLAAVAASPANKRLRLGD